MKKKGDLSLSMNAIVILILAITLLGLGLTFMRGLFKTMTSKVNEAVSAQELVSPPTEDTQMTVAPSVFNLRAGEAAKAVIAYMSTDPSTSGSDCSLTDCACKAGQDSSCSGNEPAPIYSDATFTLLKGQINTWTVVTESPKDITDPCTVLCSCTMSCSGSSDLTYGKDYMITWTP